jgi:hypothetical protein
MGSKMLGSLKHVKLNHASDIGQVVKQRAVSLHWMARCVAVKHSATYA